MAEPKTKKSSGVSNRLIQVLCILVVMIIVNPTFANPVGGVVSAGSATITQTPNNTAIQQQSSRAVIDWASFNIAPPETTSFQQPAGGIALNRINPANGFSNINGRLTATGTIFLINTAGIVFGPSANVDVAGLVASTTNMSNQNFMSGKYIFDQPSPTSSGIINQGTITARDGGLVALMAPGVENSGVIKARLGKVVLGAGQKFTLDLYGDQLINFAITEGASKPGVDPRTGRVMRNGVSNTGSIVADGGSINVSAQVAKNVVDNAINMEGVAQARSVGVRNGVISLFGGNEGVVRVTGRLLATGYRSGERGGVIHITGKRVVINSPAKINASGDAGGGEILIGGNYRGQGPLTSAELTQIDPGVIIKSNAITSGNGGTIVVWSRDDTQVSASLSAKGGLLSGNGGLIETSGHRLDVNGVQVDLSAPHGSMGTWLLDPFDLSITAAGSSGINTSGGTTFTGNSASSVLNVGTLVGALGTSNVTVLTTSSGTGGNGDIFVNTPITWHTGTTLTLSAFRNIQLNANITNDQGGSVNLRADNTGTGVGTVSSTGGSFVQLSGGATPGVVSVFYNPAVFGTQDTIYSGGTTPVKYMLINQLGTATDSATTRSLGALSNPSNASALWSQNFALAKNIDATATTTWNNGAGFSPIGGPDLPVGAILFTGNFNGLGNVISNLTINVPVGSTTAGGTGFFGVLGNNVATVNVSNLGLVNATVSSNQNNVGILAGIALTNVNITNTFTTGSVTAGINTNNTFSQANNTGGLVGNNGATITSSYSSADVIGTNSSTSGVPQYLGGLVGQNAGIVRNSYATGAVTGGTSIFNRSGGFVGNAISFAGNIITNSYSTGLVSGGGVKGGFAGANSGGTATNSYWDTTTSGQLTSGLPSGVTGLTSTQFLQSSNFNFPAPDAIVQMGTAGNTNATWYQINGATRPILGSEYGTQINTAHQFQLMNKDTTALTENYTLGRNVDASGTSLASDVWATGATGSFGIGGLGGFISVGGLGTTFSGSLNGQMNAIIDLYSNGVTSATLSFTGPFASVNSTNSATNSLSGTLQNLGIINENIQNITDATNAGFSTQIGGLVGGAGSGVNLTNVYTSGGTVADYGQVAPGLHYLGGLVGFNAGNINNSYSNITTSALGNAASTDWNGGITAAYVGGTSANNYSIGHVNGGYNVAGLIPVMTGGSFTNSYTSGLVTGGTNLSAGAMVALQGGTFGSTNYWDPVTTGQSTGGGGSTQIPSSLAALTSSTYVGFSITQMLGAPISNAVWYQLNGHTRPILASEYSTQINTAHQLTLINKDTTALGANYTLGTDIDASRTSTATDIWAQNSTGSINGFLPIGNSNFSAPFTGTFDGRYRTISNLTTGPSISSVDVTSFGLFGDVSGGNVQIKNLNLDSPTFIQTLPNRNYGFLAGTLQSNGANNNFYNVDNVNVFGGSITVSNHNFTTFIGGLVGKLTSATISNSSSSSTLNNPDPNAVIIGGLVGSATNSSILNSYNTGNLTSTRGALGGLVGTMSGKYAFQTYSISGSSNTGTITGSTAIEEGGLVGTLSGNASINNSYNIGSIIGTAPANSKIGGLVGSLTSSVISNSYNTGGVTLSTLGSTDAIGGLVGNADNSGTTGFVITGSYNTGSFIFGTGLNNTSVGGLVGNIANGSQISSSYNTGSIDNTFFTTLPFQVGGLFGSVNAFGGTSAISVQDSYNTGSLSASSSNTTAFLGGIGGSSGSNFSNLIRVFNTGPVSSTSANSKVYLGGLLGQLGQNTSITDSINYAPVVGISSALGVGGVVGQSQSGTSLTRVINTGYVSGLATAAGGLIGAIPVTPTVTDSFWDVQASGQASAAPGGTISGATGKTTAQLQAQSSYPVTYNFATTWGIINNVSYPYLSTIFATAPRIISGTAGSANAPITIAANGTIVNTVYTGANNAFYDMVPNGTIADGQAVLGYLSNGVNFGNFVAIAPTSNGSITGLSFAANTLGLGSSATATISNSDLVTAKGSISTNNILYSFSGNNLILGNATATTANLSTTPTTTYNISGNITPFGSTLDSMTFNGPVLVSPGSFTLATNSNPVALNGLVNSSDSNNLGSLTINTANSGAGSTVTFGSSVGNNTALSSLAVTGTTIAINGGLIQTSGVGGQTYTGAVTLGADTNLFANAGPVLFTNTVNSSGSSRSLTINTSGTTTFSNNVGNILALSALFDDQGTTLITNSLPSNTTTITTNGTAAGLVGQSYNNITLGSNASLSSTGSKLINVLGTIDGTSSGAQSLSINSNSLEFFTGLIGGSVKLSSLTITGPGIQTGAVFQGGGVNADTQTYSVPVFITMIPGTMTGLVQTYNSGVSMGVDTIFQANTLSFNGGNQSVFAGGLLNPSITFIGMTPATTIGVGGGTGTSQITLTDINALDQTTNSKFSSINFGNGTTTAAITTGTTALTFSKPVTFQTTGAVTLNGSILTNSTPLTFNSSSVSLGGSTTLDTTNSGASPSGANINFSSVINGAQNFAVNSGTSGLTTLPQYVGGVTPLTSFTSTGALAINGGGITTSNQQTYNAGPVTLGANTVLLANSPFNGPIFIDATINSDSSLTPRSLTVTSSNTQPITFNGLVGNINPLSSVTATAPSITISGGGVNAATQNYNGLTIFNITPATMTGSQSYTRVVNPVVQISVPVTFIGDALSFNGSGPDSVVRTGGIAQPIIIKGSTPATSIGIGGAAGTLQLTTSTIDAIASGFSSVTIGDAATGSGTLSINTATFKNPMFFESPNGSIVLNGTLSSPSNAMTFDGPISLAGTSSINTATSGTGANININSTVNGAQALTLSNGSTGVTTLAQAIGNTTPLQSFTSNGTTALNGGAVATTGLQTYNGNVQLGADTNLSTTNNPINFTGTINGARSLTANVGNGLVTLGGAVGNTTPLNSLSIFGFSQLNGGSVITTGTQTYNGGVTLGANTQLTTTNSQIAFGNTIDGARTLTLSPGLGLVVINGQMGAVTPLTSFTKNGLGTTNVNGGLMKTTGTQTYTGPVALGAADTFTGSSLTFNGLVSSNSPSSSFTENGAIAINGGGVTTSGVGGQVYNGAVTLGADTTLNAGSAPVNINSTVNSSGSARALTVNSTGITTIGGIIGGLQPLASLVNNLGTTAFNAPNPLVLPSVITTGAQSYNNVTLGDNAYLKTTNSPVTFAGTVNGAKIFNIDSGNGLITFNGAVGGVTPLETLTAVGTGAVQINGGLIDTNNYQTYNGQVLLGGADFLNAGGVIFKDSVSSNSPSSSLVINAIDIQIQGGGGVTTSGAGGQVYNGLLTLWTDTNFTAGSGAPVIFGEVSSAIIPKAFTVNTAGTTTLGGDVGSFMRMASVNVTGGLTQLAGDIYTTGNQTYNGGIFLYGNHVVDLTLGGNFTMGGTLSGGYSLSALGSGGSSYITLTGPVNKIWDIYGNNQGNVAFSGSSSLLNYQAFNNLTGSGNDTFLVGGGSVTGAINGGGGTSVLQGANAPNAWVLTGPNAGTVTNVGSFSNMPNLNSGASTNYYYFNNGGGVGGVINGGAGVNTFNYSTLSSPVVVNLGQGAATSVGGFSHIQNFIGGSGSNQIIGFATPNIWSPITDNQGSLANPTTGATVNYSQFGTLTGGVSGLDVIVGPNKPNSWNLTGGSGLLNDPASFNNFSSVMGGASNDTFNLSGGVGVTNINGGGGNNTLNLNTTGLITLNSGFPTTGSVVMSTGGIYNFTNINSLTGNFILAASSALNSQLNSVVETDTYRPYIVDQEATNITLAEYFLNVALSTSYSVTQDIDKILEKQKKCDQFVTQTSYLKACR